MHEMLGGLHLAHLGKRRPPRPGAAALPQSGPPQCSHVSVKLLQQLLWHTSSFAPSAAILPQPLPARSSPCATERDDLLTAVLDAAVPLTERLWDPFPTWSCRTPVCVRLLQLCAPWAARPLRA